MPREDGTGPLGQGSMTGRGAGPCAQTNQPGLSGSTPAAGPGLGLGLGLGRGRGLGGGGRGQGGRGQGGGWRRGGRAFRGPQFGGRGWRTWFGFDRNPESDRRADPVAAKPGAGGESTGGGAAEAASQALVNRTAALQMELDALKRRLEELEDKGNNR